VEMGSGLASEFGNGSGGSTSPENFGWYPRKGVSNGVLGHDEVNSGEAFLKIGVGQLIKDGSSFKGPPLGTYKFAKDPIWTMMETSSNSIVLEHEEMLRTHGYRLRKDISLTGKILSVTSTLTNLGKESFSTPWYCHNFYSCDGKKIGPGYELDLELTPKTKEIYTVPSWAQDITDFAEVTSSPPKLTIKLEKSLPDTTAFANFNEGKTTGTFTLNACGTSLKQEIPEVLDPNNNIEIYAFKIFVTDTTLSPEAFLLIKNLEPNQFAKWTQKVTFGN